MDELKDTKGVSVCLNSEEEGFVESLTQKVKDFKADVCLECVAGDMPAKILRAMGKGATCIVYGQLSEQKIHGIQVGPLMARDQHIQGWLLPYWLKEQGTWGTLGALKEAKRFIQHTKIAHTMPLAEAKEAIARYQENMAAGKIILKP